MADQAGAVTTDNQPQMTRPPQTLDNTMNARVVGVRFRDGGRVFYFDSREIAVEVGDWVVADTNRGHQMGRVVIAPHQVRLNMLAGNLEPIVRRLSAQEVAQMERPEQQGCLSHENERYQQMKAQLPRLGQRVDTPLGPGIVVALQIMKERVNVRLEADNAPHEFTMTDFRVTQSEQTAPS